MITEDYVSFEIAKLLKEKGFDEGCSFVVNAISKNVIPVSWPTTNSDIEDEKANLIALPTLQMAMKWLREIRDIYVDISICVITKNTVKYNINVYYKKHKNDSMYMGIHLTKECSKYEQACEVGIKYSLENLI